MHKGVFVGAHARNNPKKVLILGESHHWAEEDYDKTEDERSRKEATYYTYNVLKRYLDNYEHSTGRDRDHNYRFFDNIVKSIGVDPETERIKFWNSVYFGNYVEKLCGVGDAKAKKAIRDNRTEYNSHLIEFINKEHIDYVFCYSYLTYNNLPSCNSEVGDTEVPHDSSEKPQIIKCIYKKGDKEFCDVQLDHDIAVYKIRHPSRGFSYSKYAEIIKDIVKTEGIF